ncbi:PDZ and LIM domain protein 7 [Xiphophorus couchianus]|uniref:PDZ and LIM domain protein 7 n=1 Tax=Xiphophorus couchianus TaxID=32473 RepID=UPI001016C396|nr:PDZ and LIM domain protein 7 [Xiphophorus couchianus]
MSGEQKEPQEAMNMYSVTLSGPAPWGFRLQGGKDFSMPLTVSRLTPGGKAAQAGVGVGDWVVSICDANAEDMTHVEAQNKIRAATDSLTLTLSRAQTVQSKEQRSQRVENVPCFIPNDRSKKRLIEDTEDWQPRTGTTQSRSFRILAQLTGTDFMQDPDDENMKRSREKFLTEIQSPRYARLRDWHHDRSARALNIKGNQTGNSKPRSARFDQDVAFLEPTPSSAKTQAADKPDGSKTAAAAAGTSGPSCRPPWVTDPKFADRYRPDKTSTVVTQHQQPVQPTPMQNRSSILQAAQQAPEDSGRTPVCGACNKIIRGRYLVALGRSWHPEEFTCSQCKAVLEEGGFFEERGSVYCTKCHDNRYAPNCAKCKKIITGEIMHALKMTYHVQCFKCAACKNPIRNQAFYMEEGEPYCERDYEKMFGTKCHGCDFKIDAGDRFLEALGYSWHDTCFVCALCQINLEGKTFYSKKDKPLCKGHAFAPV